MLGRTVRYKPISEKAFVKAAQAMKFPTFQIAQVRHYANEHRNGGFVGTTDHVESVTGKPPEDFDTIAHRYLNDPSHIATEMHAGSKRAALRLGLRIARTRPINLDKWEKTRDYPLISNGLLAHANPDWMESSAQRPTRSAPRPLNHRRLTGTDRHAKNLDRDPPIERAVLGRAVRRLDDC